MKDYRGSTRLFHRTDVVDLLRKRRGGRHQRRTQREAKIVRRQIHRLPSWIQTAKYWCIDSSRNNRKWPHHVVVLVFDDMAVIDVGLRRSHACWQIILRANRGELAGICFHRVLEAALRWIRRPHRAGCEWSGIDATRHAIGTTISLLIGLHIERCSPDHLERNKVAVDWVRVSGHVDVNPVLN